MGLVEAKKRILEALWVEGRPVRSRDVARKVELGIAATTMHLLGLRKGGYVCSPEHGQYAITDLGKDIIGIPRIGKEHAMKILNHVDRDRAFHFYTGTHQYTGAYANNLSEFCDKIENIDVKSIEFHVARNDFENWFRCLGDLELAKRMSIIRNMDLHGEDLREKVYKTIKLRREELERLQP